MARWPFQIALNRERNLAYVVTYDSLETFAIAGGTFRSVGAAPLEQFGGFVSGLSIDRRAKRLYMSHDFAGTITVNAIDRQTGMLRLPAAENIKAGDHPRAMVIDPTGRFLYVTSIPKQATILGYGIDARTGLLAALATSPFKGADGADAMTITPNGAYLYATDFGSDRVSGFAIDAATGALSQLAGSPFTAGVGLQGIVSCRRSRSGCN